MDTNQATMTVKLPQRAVEQIETYAEYERRSVLDAVQDLILRSLSGLPKDVKDELASFAGLSDDVLWLLARSTLPLSQQEALAHLNAEAQRRVFSEEESTRQQELLGGKIQ